MNIKSAWTCLLAIFFISWHGAAIAQVDTQHRWKSLSSEHFHIHFQEELEAKARRVLAMAEQVHQRLTVELEWTPHSRTHITLSDQYDLANGGASPLPFNRILLYAMPPDGLNQLQDFDDWLELVFTHEYTHILHLDQAHGLPAIGRRLFGRFILFFPHLFQPLWMIEGLAITKETDAQRGVGRAQSSHYHMLMRMEVANGIKPFDQVSITGTTQWPMGTTAYLYGTYFFQYVQQRHGPEKVQALVRNYSNNGIPFLLNSNLRRSLGLAGKELWEDFEHYLQERFQPQLASIHAAGLIQGKRLTRTGFNTASPRALADGRVLYVQNLPDRRPALMLIKPGQEQHQFVSELHFSARIDAHPDAGILVAQPEVCRNVTIFYDLYHVDAETGRSTRLTHCQRYRFANWSPDGTRIAAAGGQLGQSTLDMLTANGELIATIWEGEEDVVLSHMDWSPDGRFLAASLWRPGRGWALEMFDLASRQWQPLTHDSTIESQPAFTPDGRALLFTSDHGGVYNLRHMDLLTGETVTLTNVAGGAFSPTQSAADDAIYYLGYTASGFDLFRLDAPFTAHTLPAGRNRLLDAPAKYAEITTPTRPYRPWSSMAPRFWLPETRFTSTVKEVGFSTAGFDALELHDYQLQLTHELNENLTAGGIGYTYADRISLFANRSLDYQRMRTGDNPNDLARVRTQDTYQALMTLPVSRLRWYFGTHIGAGITLEQDHLKASGQEPLPDNKTGFAGLAFTYNNTTRHLRSVSENDGRRIRLVGESNAVFGSDNSGEVYTLDWQEFLPIGGQHVLAVRLLQGWGTDAPRLFRLGGTEALSADWQEGLFDRRSYSLRGYPDQTRGRRIRLLSGEWRFPLIRPERGLVRLPLGLQQISGRLIAESGNTWDTGDNPESMLSSVGAEIVSDMSFGYVFPLRLRLGVAQGVSDGGKTEGYLLMGGEF